MAPGIAQATVYPNPACSLAWLEWEQESEGLLRWYITDIAGRQIGGERQLQLRLPGRYRQPLSIGSLPSGLYLVILDDGSSKKVLKLVKR
ncbi:MAG: T9SS type A sorting domain-containing protein [Bacteroidetes bacterium]|nr:T9SS type A sorting domain-containing protein [Bacteroidota bacterium]